MIYDFFKQKTAYEIKECDWSSDVCSSDLSHFLMQYGLSAEPRPGLRGVWVKGKKIASIGIGVKRWVTYHGLAININTDLTPFSFIRPCGIEGVEMASLKTILGGRLYINDAKDKLKSSFEKVSLLAAAVRKD